MTLTPRVFGRAFKTVCCLLLAVSLLSFRISCGQLQSYKVKVEYTHRGFARSFQLIFKLENGLGASDFIKLVWPFDLGTSSQVSALLQSYENNKQIGVQ